MSPWNCFKGWWVGSVDGSVCHWACWPEFDLWGHRVEWESWCLSSGLYYTTYYPQIKKTKNRKELLGASPVCSIILNWTYTGVTCPSVLLHTEAGFVCVFLLIGSCLRDTITEVSLMKCLFPVPYLFCSEPYPLPNLLVSPLYKSSQCLQMTCKDNQGWGLLSMCRDLGLISTIRPLLSTAIPPKNQPEMTDTKNPGSQKAEIRGLWFCGQSGLHSIRLA